MWSVWKEFLLPGRVVVPGGPAGRAVAAEFTPADVRRAVALANRKVGRGWAVPLCWEHQDVGPVRLSRAEELKAKATGVFGWATGFRLNPATGRGEVRLEGPDDADLRQFEKVRFVSPELDLSWRDSTGKVWPGPLVRHVAATARPVQHRQAPLDPAAAVRLSHTRPGVGARIRLGLDHYTGGRPVADENDTPAGDAGGDLGALIEALRGAGMTIPDEVKDVGGLIIAVKASSPGGPADDGPADDPDDLDDTDLDGPIKDAAEEAPPLAMSLQKQTARAEALARRDLSARNAQLLKSGRITPAIRDSVERAIRTVKLSFAADGDVEPNPVLAKIEAYEALPKGTSWTPGGKRGGRVRMSQAEEIDPPAELNDPGDDRTDKDFLDAWDKTA